MPKPRESTRVTQRRQEVAARYLRGELQTAIARALHITQACVSKDLKVIRAEWMTRSVRDVDVWIQEELAKILTVEHAAWQGYARSLLASKRTVQVGDKVSTTTEHRTGDRGWLDTILRCFERRASLLGLDKAKKYQVYFDSLSDEQLRLLADGASPAVVLSMPAPAQSSAMAEA